MKIRYIIGNWKSNKTEAEAKEWLDQFQQLNTKYKMLNTKTLSIVLCVPFTVLSVCKREIDDNALSIALGAQDVSPFGKGAFTGEITAGMVAEFARYVLIGHSERRRYFEEKEEELRFEVLQAHSAGLTTICCVEGDTDPIPDMADIVAYEPPGAIGKGKAEEGAAVQIVCAKIKEKVNKPVLYGGSVTPDNAAAFIREESIDGVLVGGASLDADQFFHLITSVC